ncbi:hypothetical protein [Mesorhizobium sp.]|uniref:hypothetical protein n=1 Tax=Mesorhizobium sp. TaxID=1871066 RepID=UPI001217A93B|nr:hypothetical protein [Mesorhizobium sp.]TIL48844.1 MAG: hypothetical protein E5Y83_29360 [Mesorhizobium sp.]
MSKRETVECVDGRVYHSDDNWQTVYLTNPGGKARRVTGEEADLARFLAMHANPAHHTARAKRIVPGLCSKPPVLAVDYSRLHHVIAPRAHSLPA